MVLSRAAPSVMNQRLWRDKRLHVEPFFAFTIADEYARSLIVGGELRFHFLDWLGIGGWGGYSVGQLDTNLTREVRDKGSTTPANYFDLPSRESYPSQVGRLTWWAGIEAHFVPFRGKLAMFQKVFVDADIDVFAGVAFVGVEERQNVTDVPNPPGIGGCLIEGETTVDDGCLRSQTARSKRTAIAPSFGIAFNAFFKEFVGISFRWRGYPVQVQHERHRQQPRRPDRQRRSDPAVQQHVHGRRNLHVAAEDQDDELTLLRGLLAC